MKKLAILIPVGILFFLGLKAQQPFGGVGGSSSSGIGGFPLLAPDGSVAAPSYAFNSSSGTGLYYTATQLGFTVAGGSAAFIDSAGINSRNFRTFTNCSSAASPAVCASAAAGSVVVAAAATTVVVNTTLVTANSNIFLMYDSSLGTKLSVTCNVTEPALYGVTARTAATSFTITSTAPVTNPACFSYLIVN
jgi:hypothetical protein